ncbi:hypothetical protein [Micromonospora maritima]|uniref:hypothetical protein n=1 Tax=Micromonospora maritima TaxID=986711 RepID=UPI00157C3C17|nr:hypothetical protein [Micromonospora maritima]
MDSIEVCTEYLEKWLLNDPSEVLFEAQEVARCGDLEELEQFVVGVLDDAPAGSSAWHTRRAFTPGELETRIDWAEVSRTILCED